MSNQWELLTNFVFNQDHDNLLRPSLYNIIVVTTKNVDVWSSCRVVKLVVTERLVSNLRPTSVLTFGSSGTDVLQTKIELSLFFVNLVLCRINCQVLFSCSDDEVCSVLNCLWLFHDGGPYCNQFIDWFCMFLYDRDLRNERVKRKNGNYQQLISISSGTMVFQKSKRMSPLHCVLSIRQCFPFAIISRETATNIPGLYRLLYWLMGPII